MILSREETERKETTRRLDFEYFQTHCRHCGRKFTGQWQICPDDICNDIHSNPGPDY